MTTQAAAKEEAYKSAETASVNAQKTAENLKAAMDESAEALTEAKAAYEKAVEDNVREKTAEAEAEAARQAEEDLAKTRPGTISHDKGATFRVLTNVSGSAPGTVVYTKAPNRKSVTVPETVVINGKTFLVTEIGAKAFTGKKIRTATIGKNIRTIKKYAFRSSKAVKLIVKTTKLTKASVKGSLKSSKIKTIQVKVSTRKSANKKYIKKYKKIFTKAVAGKKATVK